MSGAERDAAARAGTRAQCGRRGGTRRSQALLALSVCRRSLPRAGASFPPHGRPHSVCSTVTLLLGVHWLQRTQSLKALGQGHGQWGPSWCPPTLHPVGSPLVGSWGGLWHIHAFVAREAKGRSRLSCPVLGRQGSRSPGSGGPAPAPRTALHTEAPSCPCSAQGPSGLAEGGLGLCAHVAERQRDLRCLSTRISIPSDGDPYPMTSSDPHHLPKLLL